MDLSGSYCGAGADFVELGQKLSVSMNDGKCYPCFVGYNLAKESTEMNQAMEASYQCSSYGIQMGIESKVLNRKIFRLLCHASQFRLQ